MRDDRRLGDAAGDGWGNSHIGVKQGDFSGHLQWGLVSFFNHGLVFDSDEKVDVYYFEVGGPQQPPQETEFQTLLYSGYKTMRYADG